MASIDAVLTQFDESKSKVRGEIREGFFHPDGTLKVSERDLRAWIADRAVDELKVVFQLSAVLARSAHLIPGDMLAQITEQLSDESRHFNILRSLVPHDMHDVIDQKVAALPAGLNADTHWQSLLVAVEAGNPFAALLDINIVHEGFSAAAIEELAEIPFEDIRLAYATIGADEDKHHESGRDLLEWLIGAAQVDATSGSLLRTVHERAGAGTSMAWSWPQAADVIEHAHQRAGAGASMAWSWPAAVPSTDAA